MRSLITAAAICALSAYPAFSQQNTKENVPAKDDAPVVLSGRVTTTRIADPNTPIVFNGYVMRVADFVAVVSQGTEAEQHLRTPETQSHELVQPTPPSKPSH